MKKIITTLGAIVLGAAILTYVARPRSNPTADAQFVASYILNTNGDVGAGVDARGTTYGTVVLDSPSRITRIDAKRYPIGRESLSIKDQFLNKHFQWETIHYYDGTSDSLDGHTDPPEFSAWSKNGSCVGSDKTYEGLLRHARKKLETRSANDDTVRFTRYDTKFELQKTNRP